MFSYVDIIGCEGWLNLFFDDYCVAFVNNKQIAEAIRAVIKPKYNLDPAYINIAKD